MGTASIVWPQFGPVPIVVVLGEKAMDKALVAWGVKSPPGEPEIDFKEKIKSAGVAGALAYGATELAFWIVSVPLAIFTYYETTGEWLDLTSLEGKEKVHFFNRTNSHSTTVQYHNHIMIYYTNKLRTRTVRLQCSLVSNNATCLLKGGKADRNMPRIMHLHVSDK